MNYNVLTILPFDKQLKRLAKKYPSLKIEFAEFLKSLENEPKQGVLISNNCYKIRIAISSKGKGKSSGARVIVNVIVEETTVFLLTIYDKSEQNNLTDSELKKLLKYIEV